MIEVLTTRPGRVVLTITLLFILVLPLRGSTIDPTLQIEQVRRYSRPYEFDYVSWTVSALWNKAKGFSLGADGYLPSSESRTLVLEYLELRDTVNRLEEDQKNILADPDLEDPQKAAEDVRKELEVKRSRRRQLSPFVQEIVQRQINTALTDLNLTLGGQAFPPVMYQAEPDSYALVISPRDVIHQDANILLVSELTLEERVALEQTVENNLNLSALVVGVGGVGLYPAMVIESGSVNWLLEVIGHEWTHNYLTLHPLGMRYFSSPELRTINETVAELAGQEIKRAALKRYYPDRVPPEEQKAEEEKPPSLESLKEELFGEHPDRFDFRFEMHITRLTVDRLLREGRIKKAEAYMNERRQFFWDHGYRIRKINQAYFAFHGSYAAQPGGATGAEENRLGQNLRELKSSMPSFAAFMRKVAWMWRMEQFQSTFQPITEP